MPFVNPIEILELQYIDIANIDDNTIKRGKKKLSAEIDLSDEGFLNYRGHRLTKSDCEKAIGDLENRDSKEYYYQLATTIKLLNDYLVSGTESFFAHFKHESIFQLPDFIDFINPFFAQNFDQSLVKSFKQGDSNLVSSILRTQLLINSPNLNTAFKSLSVELQNRISEIDKTTSEINSGKPDFANAFLPNALNLVKRNFPFPSINSLPSYFQSQINKIAQSINYLQLAIWEKTDNTEISYELLAYLLQLNIESVHKPTFERNFDIVKKRNDERLEQEQNKPIFKKWAENLSEIDFLIKSIDEKTIIPSSVSGKLNQIVPIPELNGLPEFANEIRTRVGYSLRSLSISCWNSQKDIDAAIFTIRVALQVNLPPDVKNKFTEDLNDLSRIKAEKVRQGEPIRSAPSLKTVNGIGTTIYGSTLYFVILAIPVIPIARYNCIPTGNGYRFYGKLKLHKWQQIWKWGLLGGIALWILIAIVQSNSDSSTASYKNATSPDIISDQTRPTTPSLNSSTSDTTTTANLPSSNSYSPANNGSANSSPDSSGGMEYKSVTIKNGNISGCADFLPQYDREIDNKLIISAEMTDAAVKIVNYETDKCIRFVFVKNGTTYIARHIPEGKYYLKIAYGYNWSVRNDDPTCMGHFSDKPSYKKDLDLYDFNKKYEYDGTVSIPYYTLKLYRTYTTGYSVDAESGNSISEQEFKNN
jgi:hypothetical protein